MIFSRRNVAVATLCVVAALIAVLALAAHFAELTALSAVAAPLLANLALAEKRQTRGQHIEAMRKLLDKATAEKRGLTAEEKQEHERLDSEQERLHDEIAREEKQAKLDAEMRETPPPRGGRPDPDPSGTRQVAKAFRALYGGQGGEIFDSAEGALRARLDLVSTDQYLRGFRAYLLGGDRAFAAHKETRDMQADLFTKGGALVTPLEMLATLIKNVDDQLFMRQLATKYVVTMADGLGAPTLDADPADADWTTELKTGSNEDSLAVGRRELRPHPLAKRTKVSKKLLRLNPAAESLVLGRLAYKFAVAQEKAFLTGSGAQQPLGVFTASADGIPTSRDVSSDNTTTAPTADGLINAKYALKGAYWPRAQWIFHRDVLKVVRKLKDGNGQYIWQPGLSAGQPDRILDSPFNMSEYAPNTMTTGLYVGIIGDFSNYWIVDALDLTIQALIELYAETNQNGYIGRMETDGQPVLAEAFARVKLA